MAVNAVDAAKARVPPHLLLWRYFKFCDAAIVTTNGDMGQAEHIKKHISTFI